MSLKARLFAVSKPIVVFVAVTASPIRGQAPGTVYPPATDMAGYTENANQVIEAGVNLVGSSPATEVQKGLTEYSGEMLKKLNDARLLASKITDNPQNAFLSTLPTPQEAMLSPKDWDFVRKLSYGDLKSCASPPLVCNGVPAPNSTIECSVTIPDKSFASGLRNVTILTAQCRLEAGKLVGHIVGIVSSDPSTYIGPHVTQDGRYLNYHGKSHAGYCLQCPTESRRPQNCGKGKQFFGICF